MPANPFQVSEYLVDHRRIFDAGDDPDFTAAITTGFNVDKVN